MSRPACPISCDPIVHGGMTVVGSVYEYDSIVYWLQTHCTDPTTNLILPSKFVVRVADYVLCDSGKLAAAQTDMRNSTCLWSIAFNLIVDKSRLAKKTQLLGEQRAVIARNAAAWKPWSDRMRDFFVRYSKSSDSLLHVGQGRYNVDNGLIELAATRPANTGSHFQHLNLSLVHICNLLFKNISFDGCDLSFSSFIDCHFDRCTFLRCNLTGSVFVRCRFRGEETHFYGSQVHVSSFPVHFAGCGMEDLQKWEDYAFNNANELTHRFSQIRHLQCASAITCIVPSELDDPLALPDVLRRRKTALSANTEKRVC